MFKRMRTLYCSHCPADENQSVYPNIAFLQLLFSVPTSCVPLSLRIASSFPSSASSLFIYINLSWLLLSHIQMALGRHTLGSTGSSISSVSPSLYICVSDQCDASSLWSLCFTANHLVWPALFPPLRSSWGIYSKQSTLIEWKCFHIFKRHFPVLHFDNPAIIYV